MKYTQVAADAFQKIQLNAGVLLTTFNPANPTIDRANIIGATSGGTNFTASPTYVDFGDDIDNVPANTKELKKLDSVEVKMSGTFKTADTALAKKLVGPADVTTTNSVGKITPRSIVKSDDFFDLWWVGDYSDENTGTSAGFMAIKLINALSNGGFSIQSNDNGKGDFAFEFLGHYSLNDVTVVPYEMYVFSGTASTAAATLSALTISNATLSPAFSSGVTEYTATTTNASGTVTATATDTTNAHKVVVANGDSIASGGSVTWKTGQNVVQVTVTNADQQKTYTVTVTKS